MGIGIGDADGEGEGATISWAVRPTTRNLSVWRPRGARPLGTPKLRAAPTSLRSERPATARHEVPRRGPKGLAPRGFPQSVAAEAAPTKKAQTMPPDLRTISIAISSDCS
jgi:hypothetical protein